MKSLTFNQLQLRVLALLFILFTSALVGYRYFIELPKLERSVSLLAERELDILTFSIENMMKNTSKTNYDYAVWTSTYDFMHNKNQNYLDENLVDNTFHSLGIDGIYFVNNTLNLVFGRGLHHKTGKPLTFSFYDFKKFPTNLSMLPVPTDEKGTPQTVGFLTTQNGPAIYSVNQIRTSDQDGEHRGFFISIKLIENGFTEELSKYTRTKVSFSPILQNVNLKKLPLWSEKATVKKVNVFSQVLIKDMNSVPVAVLKMTHSVGKMPSLVNQKSLIFITLLSFLFYIIYRLISITIIIPVKKLARDIKMLDEKNQYSQLSEQFTVKELVTVSKNVNELMFTVQKQNELLAQQVITDPLTQIMNRHGLKTELDDYQDRCVRLKIGFIVVMCDIDYFKNYNDSLGHMKGDETLFEIAQALDKQCNRSTDVCARFGGEEFILLFSEMSEQDLKKKMQNIITTMEINHFPHPKSPTAAHVTLSMGATIVLHTDVVDFSLPINEIIKTADKALYQAKALGRNCFVINYFSSDKLGLC
jgi:diguanylate cyclase (GGDEF)-like protein